MNIEYVPTICPYCSCGCGIHLVVKDGKIMFVSAFYYMLADMSGRLNKVLKEQYGRI